MLEALPRLRRRASDCWLGSVSGFHSHLRHSSLCKRVRPLRPLQERPRSGAPISLSSAAMDCTGVRRALLGSVAEAVMRNAPCPVLVARAQS